MTNETLPEGVSPESLTLTLRLSASSAKAASARSEWSPYDRQLG
jgi:hypothetical protein